MGRSGMKRKGRQHLPKVGTAPERRYEQKRERQAVEENMGIRPGSPFAWILGTIVIVVAIVAVIALIALD